MSAPGVRICCRDAAGAVYVEFLLAFPPVFVLFLVIVQLALLSAAQIVVQHAAAAAARSAVVVLDDDPRYYRGAPRGDVNRQDSDSRMTVIRRAAHARLAAIAPDANALALATLPGQRTRVATALGSSGATREAFALTVYLPVATAVTFPMASGSKELLEDHLPPSTLLTARVTHIVPCLVPVAAPLLCKRLGDRNGLAPARQLALRELEFAPAHSIQSVLATLRVALLQAEATLPTQTASYRYASEHKGSGS